MPASYPAVTHVIFDVDGLLLDTERLYTEATQRIADRFGKRFTWEVKERQMGRRMREVGEIVVQSLELPISVEEYTVEAQALWQQLFPTAALMPGALRLVHHLHEHGVPMALASGGGEPAFQLKTTRHGQLFSLFQHAVLASSDPGVRHGKPAPDVYQAAAARFARPPALAEHVLTFEDAPLGVKSARAAGMQCVMVPDPRMSAEGRRAATLVLPSLENFQPEMFGLPGYKD